MNEAKVVTVRQPFASLIAAGAKTLLDQAHPTEYRGRLLVRAATKAPYLIEGTQLAEVAIRAGWPDLPLGVVVASCELVDCVPVVGWLDAPEAPYLRVTLGESRSGLILRTTDAHDGGVPLNLDGQLPFGDFSPGRWVWLLDDVRPTTERCPRCWGAAIFYEPDPYARDIDGEHPECPTCKGAGVCPPVWMRGGPGLRAPEWEEM